jgi:hypothetical protein
MDKVKSILFKFVATKAAQPWQVLGEVRESLDLSEAPGAGQANQHTNN